MGLWEMIVAVVAIGAFAKIMQARYQSQQGEPSLPDVDVLRLREEMALLKDRIAVLEGVITDNNRSLELDREIERLRDNDRV
jgi:hypothetical protein